MTVNVWDYGDIFDLAVWLNVQCYNMVCFKIADYKEQISKTECTVGDFQFEPGEEYSNIGYSFKTSSGYVSYKGEPIVFVGLFDEYLLFSRKEGPVENENGYSAIFIAFRKLAGDNLFILNASTSGRIIQMKK